MAVATRSRRRRSSRAPVRRSEGTPTRPTPRAVCAPTWQEKFEWGAYEAGRVL